MVSKSCSRAQYVASLVSIKLNKEIYVNFLLNNDGEVSGVSTYIKGE